MGERSDWCRRAAVVMKKERGVQRRVVERSSDDHTHTHWPTRLLTCPRTRSPHSAPSSCPTLLPDPPALPPRPTSAPTVPPRISMWILARRASRVRRPRTLQLSTTADRSSTPLPTSACPFPQYAAKRATHLRTSPRRPTASRASCRCDR